MIAKIQLTQSDGLPVGVLMHDREHRFVQKTTKPRMVESALIILRGQPVVYLLGSMINGLFTPEAHVSAQNW